jgi:hypothetical protein
VLITQQFLTQKELIRGLTPREANLIVPKEFVDQPVMRLFNSSSIAKAPLDWLEMVTFQVCPFDIAYAKMAILLATQGQENDESQVFFEKMPGFDDIFGHWVGLLAVSELPDPKGLITFMN